MQQSLRFVLSLVCLSLLGFAAYQWLPYSLTDKPDTPKAPIWRAVANTTELQIALARAGFSPGAIDGSIGEQTRLALLAYQHSRSLPLSGEFDLATQSELKITDPVYSRIELSAADFARIDSPPTSWKERGTRSRMAYYSILEMVAEKSMTDPDFIQQLNPEIDWSTIAPGTLITAPYMRPLRIQQAADHLRISLNQRTLQAINADGAIIFHSPVSIARSVDKRPSGELRVKVRVENPNYTFNPAILAGTAAREGITDKFIIQPGPNNPVGTVWIGLNLPSYGIHGTPEPEKVGRTESSGCFRLANWNAETLIAIVSIGTSVYVEP